MEVVHRVALVVRPKLGFVEWAKAIDALGSRSAAAAGPASVYLIDGAGPHALKNDRYAVEILEHELGAWTSDVTLWPEGRTPGLFHDWFDVALVDQLWDLDEHERLVGDQVAGACAWCCRPLIEGDSVLTVRLIQAPNVPCFPPGPLALEIEGRTIPAMVPVRQSEEGQRRAGVLVLVCSGGCASKVSEGMGLGGRSIPS